VKVLVPDSTTDGTLTSIPPDLIGQIISTASDLALIVSREGVIRSVLANPHHRTFGSLIHWEGKPLKNVLTVESIGKYEARVQELSAQQGSRAVELNHVDEMAFEFPIRYALHLIASDGSILMLGRDLRPIAEMQQQLVKAQLALERDYEAQREIDTRYRVLMETTRDAIVVVSMTTGRIVDLNMVAGVMLGGSRTDLIGAAIAQEFVEQIAVGPMHLHAIEASGHGVTCRQLEALHDGRQLVVAQLAREPSPSSRGSP